MMQQIGNDHTCEQILKIGVIQLNNNYFYYTKEQQFRQRIQYPQWKFLFTIHILLVAMKEPWKATCKKIESQYSLYYLNCQKKHASQSKKNYETSLNVSQATLSNKKLYNMRFVMKKIQESTKNGLFKTEGTFYKQTPKNGKDHKSGEYIVNKYFRAKRLMVTKSLSYPIYDICPVKDELSQGKFSSLDQEIVSLQREYGERKKLRNFLQKTAISANKHNPFRLQIKSKPTSPCCSRILSSEKSQIMNYKESKPK